VEGYGHGCDGLREAVDGYAQAQDELVEARNRLARAIAGAAMSGMTQDEIVEATGYSPELVQRIVADAGQVHACSGRAVMFDGGVPRPHPSPTYLLSGRAYCVSIGSVMTGSMKTTEWD
jgi:hypothetical protein